ncbi:MAG: right-handed parallel beta-helix repeat-containing protein [Kiritimatiellaeota bacterium]|nr:right-handed parallel beta-helix repeat-containing protein [Kiritimatiellota bacterium]
MKNRLILSAALLTLFGATHAAEFFVAPKGDDANSGTEAKPFATVQRAQQAATAGDVIFIRGGTYRLTEAQLAHKKGIFAAITFLDKSGAPGKPIIYRSYKDEKPVFDCSAVKPAGMRVSAFSVTGSWLHLQGLEVTGVQVTIKTHTQSICFENNGSHNIYERILMHDGQAIGIYSVRGCSNLFLNCDAWNNWDYTSEDGKGGNTDGFGCHPPTGSAGNVFRGCRAWYNSDDGYDCIGAAEAVTFENCWAFYSGLNAAGAKLGDGNGFKAGGYGKRPASALPVPIPRHVIRGCLAVGNRASGFYANHHPGGCDWFNNTAYRNGSNFNFLGRLADNLTDVPGSGHRIRNNVSYRSRGLVTSFKQENNTADYNTFAPDMKLIDRDFVSLDEKQLTLPRQANGDLPVITLLHPAAGSTLLGAGVDVGLPFRGDKPDLGAFAH